MFSRGLLEGEESCQGGVDGGNTIGDVLTPLNFVGVKYTPLLHASGSKPYWKSSCTLKTHPTNPYYKIMEAKLKKRLSRRFFEMGVFFR